MGMRQGHNVELTSSELSEGQGKSSWGQQGAPSPTGPVGSMWFRSAREATYRRKGTA